MKIKILFAALILSTAILFTSCNNEPKNLIVKKWKAIAISGGKTDAFADSVKKNMIASVAIEFTKDGKYSTTGSGVPNEGTYSISEDGKILSMTNAAGILVTSNIDEITRNELVLTDKMGVKFTLEPNK